MNRSHSFLNLSQLYFFTSLLVLALTGGVCATVHAALIGDVNGDDRVTVQDAVRVLKYIKGFETPSFRDRLLGDAFPAGKSWVNDNGDRFYGNNLLNQADVSVILQYALGLLSPIHTLPAVYTIGGIGPSYPQSTVYSVDGKSTAIHVFTPWDLAIGQNGEVYFSENHAARIRIMLWNGEVTTLAGDVTGGFVDGPKATARFRGPEGLATLPDGSIVVADTFNHAIRKVTRKGYVTTLGGNGKRGFLDGIGKEAQFREPSGVATDLAGNVYVADTFNNRIRKITPEGDVTTLAGDGKSGMDDGPAMESRFRLPAGVEFDPRDGGLFIADTGNNLIRKLTVSGEVITIAGTSSSTGHNDGEALTAKFRSPYGLELDAQGRLWIADWGNEAVRVLLPNGQVQTVAGRLPEGYRDGPAEGSQFFGLMNVRQGKDNVFYLADTDNQRIRALIP